MMEVAYLETLEATSRKVATQGGIDSESESETKARPKHSVVQRIDRRPKSNDPRIE